MLRFKLLLKVKTVLEYVGNSTNWRICSFMSEFIRLTGCCISIENRTNKKLFIYFKCVLAWL